ncbi:hypothetical protein PDG61_14115 [Mycolicibacterium sp. BiH015]|nr:hypothetical protein [Mycolicibacterium sp. BiH015]MDA2892053.1 hypothetical protein [Mycolicibacterium sp. BiH015]
MTHDNRENASESTPESTPEVGDVPAANPAYATPPPGGIPDADDD